MVGRLPCFWLVIVFVCCGNMLGATTQPGMFAKGERLRVTISDLIGPGVKTIYQPLVEDDGKIGLPLVPPIDAAGHTEDEVTRSIVAAYRDANLMSDAEVSVDPVDSQVALKTARGPLKVGEHVLIRISDLEAPGKLSDYARVIDDKGEVAIPQVANHIAIANQLERDAATRIGKELLDENLISNAQVDVVRVAGK